MNEKTRVLILCTGNSARSQMAEGLLRHYGKDGIDVESAGVAPTGVREEAIEAMLEVGIDISSHRSKSVDEFLNQQFDYIITVCDNANANCPVFPGSAKRLHWSFDDPASVQGNAAERLTAFRKSRDDIAEKLKEFASAQLAAH